MKEINILPPPPNSVGNPAPFRSGGTFLFSFQLNYSAHYTHKSSAICEPFHSIARPAVEHILEDLMHFRTRRTVKIGLIDTVRFSVRYKFAERKLA